jgi:large subunit ribosomal protein L11
MKKQNHVFKPSSVTFIKESEFSCRMATQAVDVLIEGGKASAAPPLGPALGPMGVNIGQVVADINKKTADFKGMQVPVKVEIDVDTKEYTISIGTPPAAALIKQEAGIKKASGRPQEERVADLKIEQIIKIANMKKDSLLGKDNFSRVKEIIGTCDSMGVLVEGKPGRETIADINSGSFKNRIESGKSELTAEELAELEKEQKAMQAELAEKHAKEEAAANAIISKHEGKDRSAIVKFLKEAEIHDDVINKLLPEEKKE